MNHLRSTAAELYDIFDNALTVMHIAETLRHCDVANPAPEVRQEMEDRDFDVFGLSEAGIVVGYIKRSELSDGECGMHRHDFAAGDLLSDSASLLQVMRLLRNSRRYFVLVGNKVDAIVTRGDLQKAPVRMLLFGLITLVEMNLLRVIRLCYPDDKWQDYLSKGRLGKAEKLYEDRQKRDEAIDLADCLQLGDKFDIVRKKVAIREKLGYSSSKLCDLKKRVNSLRDILAHGQDLVAGSSWESVIDTADKLEELLTRLEATVDK